MRIASSLDHVKHGARFAIRPILYKESISFDWDPAQLALSAARLIDEKACRLLDKHRINQD